MHQHDYDDSGLASSYLLLSLLLPAALYQCYKLVVGSAVHPCNCKNCAKNKKGRSLTRLVFLASSVIAVSYLIHNILTIQMAKRSADFDPFTTLGVQEGASAREVQKAHKKMVRKLNLKLKKTKSAEVITAAIMAANKALKILKDPSAYDKWLSEGMEKKLIIAMPAFLIKSSVKSVGLYLLVLGIVIPWIVYRKYFSIKYRCITGAYYETTEQFYERLDGFSENEEIIIPQLILFISKAKEFRDKVWKNTIVDIKKEVEGVYCVPLLGGEQSYLQIMSYLCRTGHVHSADAEYVKLCGINLVNAGIRIAIEETKSKLCNALLVLRKMFIQAVPGPEYSFMQFPGITPEHISAYRAGNPTKNGVWKACLIGNDVDEFIKKSLPGNLSHNALAVLASLPRIAIKDVMAYTLDTEDTNSNINENVGKIVKQEGTTYKVERTSASYVSFKLVRKGGCKTCHMPYGQELLRNSWTVFYQLNSEVQSSVFTFDDFEGEKEVAFGLPMHDGSASLRVSAVSNGYFGIDGSESIIIKYY